VGWRLDKSGSFLPTYTLVPNDQHKISLTLPDGRVEEFRLTPNPSSSLLVPLQFLTAAYAAQPGTLGSLVPLGNTDLIIVDS